MPRARLHLGDDIREVDHRIRDVVYHRAREEPAPGIVTGYRVCPDEVLYYVTWGGSLQEHQHYGCELTAERPGLAGDAGQ